MTHCNDYRQGPQRPVCRADRAHRAAHAPPGVLFAVALAWACLAPAGAARAQVKHAVAIPNTIRTTASSPALTAAEQGVVNNFINTTVGYLADTTTEGQQRAARNDLESNAAALGAGATASGVYTFAYATALNKALLPLATRNQPLSVRLNAAIVTAHVAARVDNTALAPAAIAFTTNGPDPVALWGVKAAKYIWPHQLDIKQGGPFQTAVVNAVLSYRQDPALAEEAYDTFTGDEIVAGVAPGSGPPPAAPPPPTRMTAAIPAVVALMEARAGIYQAATADLAAGSADPGLANPEADNRGYSFIALPALWRAAAPNQQKEMARAGLDLLTEATHLMAALPTRVEGDPPDALRQADLAPLVNQAGAAFAVIGGLAGNNGVATAGAMLTAAKTGLSPPPATVEPRLAALTTALTSSNLVGPAVPLPKPPATAPAPAPAKPPTPSATTRPTTPTTAPPATTPPGTTRAPTPGTTPPRGAASRTTPRP